MHLTGRCHCGNLELTLDWPDDVATIPARACGCTFCRKHGASWTSHPRAQLQVRRRDPARVARYEFGTGTATFHVCTACGVPPVVTCDIDGRTYAVVNVNALEGLDPAQLARSGADFEGEDVGARLARRQRGWIGAVTLVDGAA